MKRAVSIGLVFAAASLAGCTQMDRMMGTHMASAPPKAAPAVAPTPLPTPPPLPRSDADFVVESASGGYAEIQTAELALQKSRNPRIKQFAEMMVRDHWVANQELLGIAQRRGVNVSPAMDSEHQNFYGRLQRLNGSAFDRDYMRGLVADHNVTLKMLQTYAQSGGDQELREWAAQTAPVVERHLRDARAIARVR